MRRRSQAALAALLLLAACAPSQSETVQTPEATRIVSLNPCVDAILAEVAPERLVAVSHYSRDAQSSSMELALARSFPATSGSAEEVAALAPDLVVAGAFLPPATERALTEMGIRLVKTDSIASIADARAQVRELAGLAGRVAAGEELVARIDRAIANAAPPKEEKPAAALIWQSGGLVPGEDTLISDLLMQTGFTNFSAGRGLGQGAVLPLEDVLADPPPVILNAGGGRMQSHPALAALASGTAVRQFDTRLTWCGGPTIPRAAERLAEIRRGLP